MGKSQKAITLASSTKSIELNNGQILIAFIGVVILGQYAEVKIIAVRRAERGSKLGKTLLEKTEIAIQSKYNQVKVILVQAQTGKTNYNFKTKEYFSTEDWF